MKTKKTLMTLALTTASTLCFAQKTMYIPQEWRNRTDTLIYKEEDTDNKYTWSKSRSYETDNVIVLWDKGYGTTNPSNASSQFKVDIEDLAQKCEAFYQLECDSLGFVDPDTSNLSKYKVMVLLNHTTDWVCYGGGYDYQISALWLGPSACQPVGSSVAHEVGHSFHYMCYSEASKQGTLSNVQTGFHSAVGSGSTIWETTANWQAIQSYPGEIFTMSYLYSIFPNSYNYAFTHEWQRYQSYLFLTYLCEHYGDRHTVADVWNYHETTVKDFNQVLMDLKGLSTSELYGLYFDYALHAVTWDLDACKSYRSRYIGNFNYYCVKTAAQTYQVAYASAPQSTGFNVVPLTVPDAGTEVSIEFTTLRAGAALQDADPANYLDGDSNMVPSGQTKYNTTTATRDFYLGFVAYMKDGTTQYFATDDLHCHGKSESTDTVSMTVPEGTSKLWFVVCPSPSSYVQHKWDESITNDDQWPYKMKITGTDLTADATVYQSYLFGDRGVADVTITYDVYMSTTATEATKVTVSDEALSTFGTAFQMERSEVASHMQAYSEAGPDPGKIMLYPYNSTGTLLESPSTIEEGYGYWFKNRTGSVVDADDSSAAVSAEFLPDEVAFNINVKSGMLTNGITVPLRMALRYITEGGAEAVARFNLRLHTTNSQTGYSVSSIDYDEDTALPVTAPKANGGSAGSGLYYDLTGRSFVKPSVPGIYVKDGRKVVVK